MQIVHSDVRFQHRRTVFRLEPQQSLCILYIPQLCIAVILQLVCLRIQRNSVILPIVRQIKGIRIFYRFIPLFIIKPRISLLIAVRHAALSCQSDICERIIHLRVRAEVHARKFKFFRSTLRPAKSPADCGRICPDSFCPGRTVQPSAALHRAQSLS